MSQSCNTRMMILMIIIYACTYVCTSDQSDVVGSAARVGAAALLFNFYNNVKSDQGTRYYYHRVKACITEMKYEGNN
jgi:hypothetical protein